MKKIFTLTMGILFATVLMAADRRPVVTINSSRNFKIVIDGRSYFGGSQQIMLDHFYGGQHTIKVFEMKRGYFERKEKFVGATSFYTGRNDIVINIDWFGNISIREKKSHRGYGNDDRYDDRSDRNDRNDRNGRNGRGRDRDDDDRRF